MDETTFITQPTPIDVGSVRDPGVAALIMLAASLRWNVLKKHNQPAVLTARDGTQKRLPTDGSCKMSVFQSGLSTIMVHTEPEVVPTVELMDRIIAATKPSTDHARRLRLAVGENPATHRQRVANDRVAERREGELTQRVGVIFDEAVAAVEEKATLAAREGLMVLWTSPHDGEEHGELVSRKPFMAHYSGGGNSGSPGYVYESKTSFERIWEDGYIDYECMVCGMAKVSPRAVASHRQVHTKAGEVELDTRYMNEAYRARHRESRERAKQAEAVEFVDELPVEHLEEQEQQLAEVAEVAPQHDRAEYLDPATIREFAAPAARTEEHPTTSSAILQEITKLVLPNQIRRWEDQIALLLQERNEALKRLAEVEAEFDALVDLLTSRKKDR